MDLNSSLQTFCRPGWNRCACRLSCSTTKHSQRFSRLPNSPRIYRKIKLIFNFVSLAAFIPNKGVSLSFEALTPFSYENPRHIFFQLRPVPPTLEICWVRPAWLTISITSGYLKATSPEGTCCVPRVLGTNLWEPKTASHASSPLLEFETVPPVDRASV